MTKRHDSATLIPLILAYPFLIVYTLWTFMHSRRLDFESTPLFATLAPLALPWLTRLTGQHELGPPPASPFASTLAFAAPDIFHSPHLRSNAPPIRPPRRRARPRREGASAGFNRGGAAPSPCPVRWGLAPQPDHPICPDTAFLRAVCAPRSVWPQPRYQVSPL